MQIDIMPRPGDSIEVLKQKARERQKLEDATGRCADGRPAHVHIRPQALAQNQVDRNVTWIK